MSTVQPASTLLSDPEPATALDRELVFHPWSATSDVVIEGGEGCRVWDSAGRTYLDFASQLVNVNIGHQHPAVLRAIAEQAGRLTTVAPAHPNLIRGRAAELILRRAPRGFSKVFFTNAGAEAVENAVRMARLHTGRSKILSSYRSYHGNTGAAIVATGDPRRLRNEYATGHVHFFGPFLYRSEFWAATAEQESERALQHLRRVVECEGPDTVAAILIESVPGTAGVLVPPPGYLEGVRAIADAHGIVLILDEVMSGFGRTGSWFAFELHGGRPDLITVAKGVNSGYVPAGAVIMSKEIADHLEQRFYPGGSTYGGHPLAMAAIVGAQAAMAAERIVENAARIGRESLGPGLAALSDRHPLVGEVRGEGVFWALELVADRHTKEPLRPAAMIALKRELTARRVLSIVQENRLHVAPPCVVTPELVAEAIDAYDAALTTIESA
jgi:taurine--2-oxoglutarate transaminase